MALQAEAPILPVGLAGTREIFPTGFFCGSKQAAAVVVGEPIDTTSYSVEDKESLMAEVRVRIEALQIEAEKLLENEPASLLVGESDS